MTDSIAFIYMIGLVACVAIAARTSYMINEYWMDRKYPERSDEAELYASEDEVDTSKIVSGK